MTTTHTLREAAQQALEALDEIASDYADRFDLNSPSTNPGIKSSIAEARSASSTLRSALAEPAAEPARPDIIERLTYHALERDDLTLDDCLAYLAEGWKRVRGRTERQMVLQLTALLAGAPAAEQAEPVALDVTLTEEETSFLRDTMGADEGEAPDAIRLTVGNGHSGYGLYVSLAEYGDEGSSLLKALAAPPAPAAAEQAPIDMVLHCPKCGKQHIDADESQEHSIDGTPYLTARIGWDNPPHRSHLCHGCGHIWRPADAPTNGVAAIKTKGKADSPPAPARQEPPADWSVFNTGAEVAGGLTYAEALDYLTPARLERGWSAVCVVNKDNITAAPAEGGANG